MNVRAVKTRVFKENDDIVEFITQYIPGIKSGSILVVTSKIAALAEGRTAEPKEKEKLIRAESSWAKRAYGDWWLTIRGGVLNVNAGIDESNADGKIILLPKDSFRTAARLQKALKKTYRIKKLGIIITDSRVSPLRAGATAIALGYAGFRGIRDYRGKKDIFGRMLEVSRTNVADSLATAAVVLMGEGSERCPLAVIEGAPVEFAETVSKKEVEITVGKDMYRFLFER